MAWCRAYLSAKYLAWPQCKPTSTILGILVGFFFFSAVVNQHLTCVNECTFMSICIAYYVNTYMYKCCFFFMKECQSIHLYIFRTPFHWWWPISICSAVVQLKVYWSTANKCFVFCFCFLFLMNCCVVKRYSHHVEDRGRPFSWILYFFTFCHT